MTAMRGDRLVSRGELLAVGGLLLVVGFAALGWHIAHGGFYSDDWSNAANYHFASRPVISMPSGTRCMTSARGPDWPSCCLFRTRCSASIPAQHRSGGRARRADVPRVPCVSAHRRPRNRPRGRHRVARGRLPVGGLDPPVADRERGLCPDRDRAGGRDPLPRAAERQGRAASPAHAAALCCSRAASSRTRWRPEASCSSVPSTCRACSGHGRSAGGRSTSSSSAAPCLRGADDDVARVVARTAHPRDTRIHAGKPRDLLAVVRSVRRAARQNDGRLRGRRFRRCRDRRRPGRETRRAHRRSGLRRWLVVAAGSVVAVAAAYAVLVGTYLEPAFPGTANRVTCSPRSDTRRSPMRFC